MALDSEMRWRLVRKAKSRAAESEGEVTVRPAVETDMLQVLEIYNFYILRIRRIKYFGQPENVLAVVHVGHFCTIHVKGRNRNTTGDIIPVSHYIFFRLSHGEGSSLYKN